MQLQLNLDFTTVPPPQKGRTFQKETWLDMTEIARGVGFTCPVQVSIALHDALKPLRSEVDGDCDQRLFDVLWLAHLQLSLDHFPSAPFNFTFSRKDRQAEENTDIRLRLRVEMQEQAVLVGLLQDF